MFEIGSSQEHMALVEATVVLHILGLVIRGLGYLVDVSESTLDRSDPGSCVLTMIIRPLDFFYTLEAELI